MGPSFRDVVRHTIFGRPTKATDDLKLLETRSGFNVNV